MITWQKLDLLVYCYRPISFQIKQITQDASADYEGSAWLRLSNKGEAGIAAAADIQRQELEEPFYVLAAKSEFCLRRAFLWRVDEQSGPDFRLLPYVLRLHRSASRLSGVGHHEVEGQREVLVRLRSSRGAGGIRQQPFPAVHILFHPFGVCGAPD